MQRELSALEGRKEQMEQMERDRDALLRRYAGVVPETLGALTPEERHQLYKMLRLEVIAHPDKSLEVSGAILAGGGEDGDGWPRIGGDPDGAAPSGGLGALELTRIRESQITQSIELRFRATLRKEPKVELAIV